MSSPSTSANGTRFEIPVSPRCIGGYNTSEYCRSTIAAGTGANAPPIASTTSAARPYTSAFQLAPEKRVRLEFAAFTHICGIP
jgi:hypothetical protein